MSKLTKKDKQKILNRYYTKLEEFKKLTLEELKVLYNSKISHTDKLAVASATEHIMSLEETKVNGTTNITTEQQEV